jgi:predicted nucleotidyltransferase
MAIHNIDRLDSITPESLRLRLGDLAATVPDLDLLVLFGSTVKDRRRSSSDIDLAVRCTEPADLDVLYLALAPRFRTDHLDLVDLRRAGPLLAFEVARSGYVLFERRAGAFREFQSLASRRYCDTAKLRAAQRRAIHVFLEKERLA